MSLIYDGTIPGKTKNYNQIKLAKSYNNNIFICISTSNNIPSCYINNHLINEFTDISCKYNGTWNPGFKVFYFSETDEFMMVSRNNLGTTIISNFDNDVRVCNQRIFGSQNKEYSIIYNNEDYQVINHLNFINQNESIDISAFKAYIYSKYLKEAKEFIDTCQNKEEFIENINNFIKNRIILKYINENKEMIIQKDEMNIAFTSTYIQKLNEDSNATTVNLGKCEKDLKVIYNIPQEKHLYMLKIDIEQKGKNYPIIEYEVFYPLENGKIKFLNLSYCETSDIEISIPINITGPFDKKKYNPKSSYYNNICSKTNSNSNVDIPLKDRRNEFIKNNISLCEANCEFTDYNINNKKVKCSCKVKTFLSLDNVELDSKNLLNNFLDIKSLANIDIIKCYKIVFNKNNIKNNLGLFIFIFIFILFIICLNLFYCKSQKNLIFQLNEIIKAKKYMNNNNKIIRKRKTKKIRKKIDSSLIKSKKRKEIINYKMNKSETMNIIKKKKVRNNLTITKINNNDKEKYFKNILKYNDSELSSLSYKDALRNDKRTFSQYYCSLLKRKQLIFFSFFPNRDYNSQIIKSFLFFFFYSSSLTINALFFTDDTMHKIYNDSGSFNLNYQLPQVVYSSLISSLINLIISFLSLSEKTFISIKAQKTLDKNINEKIGNMKCKFIIFFFVIFILLSIFCYYLSCFCCIYQNTQMHLIKDSLISFGLSLIYPFFIDLIPGIFRILALSNKKRSKECVYKFSQFIENI